MIRKLYKKARGIAQDITLGMLREWLLAHPTMILAISLAFVILLALYIVSTDEKI